MPLRYMTTTQIAYGGRNLTCSPWRRNLMSMIWETATSLPKCLMRNVCLHQE